MNLLSITKNSMLTLLLVSLFTAVSSFAQKTTYTDSWGKAGYTLQTQNRSGIQVNYSITEFELTDVNIKGENLKTIVLPEAFLPNDEGAPDLPGTSRFIAIPEGSTPVMKIVDYRTEVFKNIEMAPAMRIPLETEDGIEYNKNVELYSKNAFYPAQPIQLSEVTEVRGVDAVILGITPFQYNPVTRELIVYRDVKVEVEFEGGNGQFGDDRLRSRWFDPILEDVFINRESLPEIDYNAKIRNALQTRDDAGYEYLIVVPNNPEFLQWADSVQKFRQEQGILTGIVTLNEIGGSSTTILENYFNNAYNTWDIPPVAVLLLADYGTNAANSIVSPIWNSYCASDNIYADVDNNKMPDIIFARITANNSTQLQTMVSKFIDYERNPPTNPNFYLHPITALGWQTERWFQICSETVGGFWRSQGKEPVRVNAIYDGNPNVDPWSTATNTTTVVNYFGPNGLNYIPASPSTLGGWSGGTATQVNNAINNGAFMLQHRDHGYEQGWGEPAYSSTNINPLTNTDLCFVFSINCLTGKYNMSGECFTEKFHRHTAAGHNSGALGLIAASETSYSFVNDAYVWGMFDNMWPEFMPAFGSQVDERGLKPAFGNAAGKYFLQQSSWPYNTSNKEVTYNLFHHHGDAFLTVYSEVPQNLAVTHNAVLFAGENTFTVTADAGSFIALTVNGEIIGVAEGTGSPLAIEIDPQLPTNFMKVTVTRQNYYRYESMVEIIPMAGPYVVFDSYTIDDAQGGNGDGLMDCGENVLLNVTMKNAGIEVAENITVTITTEDEFVTITDGEASFGNINANSVVTLAGAFAIEASAVIPDMHTVTFEVSANDGTDSWTSNFVITAHAPLLEISDIVVSDSTGNNNGRLDPGESADIIIDMTNSGSSLAAAPMASFTANSPYVTVNTGTLYPEDLQPGATTQLVFNISVIPSAPVGTVVNFLFHSHSGSVVLEQFIGLKIGLIVEDFETGDFSKYDWEFAGNANWTVTNSAPQQGTYCAKSGDVNDNQTSTLKVTMEVISDDEISFFKKVSSEASYDFLSFYIDDNLMDQWSGSVAWSQVTYPVTAGTHTFKWTFSKDVSQSTGSDCGWIDYILLPAVADNNPVAFAGVDDEICQFLPFAPSAFASNYESLQWQTSGTGTFDDNTILTPEYYPGDEDYSAGNVTLTLSATGNGTTVSDDMTLSFSFAPTQCSVPSGETNLCINPGTTDYSTEGVSGATGYFWTITPAEAGVITFDMMVASVAWAPEFTGVAQIAVAGTNDCGTGTFSDNLEVTITALPGEATTPAGDTEICEGTTVSAYTTSEIAGAETYTWEIVPAEAGTVVSNLMNAEITWQTGWLGSAELKVTGVNFCGQGEPSSPLAITLMPLATVPAMPTGTTDLCEDNTNTTYETTGSANAENYSWEILPAEAGLITATGMMAEVDWAEGFSGIANIHVKAANSCGETAFSDALTVNIAPKPADAAAITGRTNVCMGATETYNVAEIANATTVEWVIEPANAGTLTNNGIDCSVAWNNTFTGAATLKVKGVNACGDGNWSELFTATVFDCTGIEENTNSGLSIFPNPNNGLFTIQLKGNDVVDVNIVNSIGKTVFSKNGIQMNDVLVKQLNTQNLAEGIYYLTIRGKATNITEKLVIRK